MEEENAVEALENVPVPENPTEPEEGTAPENISVEKTGAPMEFKLYMSEKDLEKWLSQHPIAMRADHHVRKIISLYRQIFLKTDDDYNEAVSECQQYFLSRIRGNFWKELVIHERRIQIVKLYIEDIQMVVTYQEFLRKKEAEEAEAEAILGEKKRKRKRKGKIPAIPKGRNTLPQNFAYLPWRGLLSDFPEARAYIVKEPEPDPAQMLPKTRKKRRPKGLPYLKRADIPVVHDSKVTKTSRTSCKSRADNRGFDFLSLSKSERKLKKAAARQEPAAEAIVNVTNPVVNHVDKAIQEQAEEAKTVAEPVIITETQSAVNEIPASSTTNSVVKSVCVPIQKQAEKVRTVAGPAVIAETRSPVTGIPTFSIFKASPVRKPIALQVVPKGSEGETTSERTPTPPTFENICSKIGDHDYCVVFPPAFQQSREVLKKPVVPVVAVVSRNQVRNIFKRRPVQPTTVAVVNRSQVQTAFKRRPVQPTVLVQPAVPVVGVVKGSQASPSTIQPRPVPPTVQANPGVPIVAEVNGNEAGPSTSQPRPVQANPTVPVVGVVDESQAGPSTSQPTWVQPDVQANNDVRPSVSNSPNDSTKETNDPTEETNDPMEETNDLTEEPGKSPILNMYNKIPLKVLFGSSVVMEKGFTAIVPEETNRLDLFNRLEYSQVSETHELTSIFPRVPTQYYRYIGYRKDVCNLIQREYRRAHESFTKFYHRTNIPLYVWVYHIQDANLILIEDILPTFLEQDRSLVLQFRLFVDRIIREKTKDQTLVVITKRICILSQADKVILVAHDGVPCDGSFSRLEECPRLKQFLESRKAKPRIVRPLPLDPQSHLRVEQTLVLSLGRDFEKFLNRRYSFSLYVQNTSLDVMHRAGSVFGSLLKLRSNESNEEPSSSKEPTKRTSDNVHFIGYDILDKESMAAFDPVFTGIKSEAAIQVVRIIQIFESLRWGDDIKFVVERPTSMCPGENIVIDYMQADSYNCLGSKILMLNKEARAKAEALKQQILQKSVAAGPETTASAKQPADVPVADQPEPSGQAGVDEDEAMPETPQNDSLDVSAAIPGVPNDNLALEEEMEEIALAEEYEMEMDDEEMEE